MAKLDTQNQSNRPEGITIDTGGGIYIAGNVYTGGDLIGRDQYISRKPTKKKLKQPEPLPPIQTDDRWQTHQAKGDSLCDRAKQADLQEDMSALWQAAQREYNRALGTRPAPGVLEMITLYRKLAITLRKQGKVAFARSEYLDKGQARLQDAKEQSVDPTMLSLEEALYQLEAAYCDFDEQKWDKLYYRAESLIKQFERDRNFESHLDFLYVVGCAYNLLAIAIEQADIPVSEVKKSSAQCWEIACNYLEQVNDKKSQDVLRDIKLNRTPQLNEEGHCDEAIKQLVKILDAEKVEPSLRTSRRIIAQQTLAAGYLYRLDTGDIDTAQALASENLAWSQRQKDVQEWVYALQLYLKVLQAQIVASPPDAASSFVKQAEAENNTFHQANKLSKTDPDELELRRLLAEIYLAANQVSKATGEIEFIKKHRPTGYRDGGDIYLTLAKWYRSKNELSEAQSKFDEARLRFEEVGHLGMVVETDQLWAEMEISQNKFDEAQKRLEETLEIAKKLACKKRVERVEAQLQALHTQQATPAARFLLNAQGIITILFLASDPSDLARLRHSEELREIGEQLQLATQRQRFQLQAKHSVRARDISRALLEQQPQIVHFSGHGAATGGLCLEDKVGKAQLASPEAITSLFQQFSQQIHCVILNACYSESQAQAIAHHIPYVIGMSHLIEDQAAIAFSIGFYQALGEGRSIEDAFNSGCTQIGLQGFPDSLTPVLIRHK